MWACFLPSYTHTNTSTTAARTITKKKKKQRLKEENTTAIVQKVECRRSQQGFATNSKDGNESSSLQRRNGEGATQACTFVCVRMRVWAWRERELFIHACTCIPMYIHRPSRLRASIALKQNTSTFFFFKFHAWQPLLLRYVGSRNRTWLVHFFVCSFSFLLYTWARLFLGLPSDLCGLPCLTSELDRKKKSGMLWRSHSGGHPTTPSSNAAYASKWDVNLFYFLVLFSMSNRFVKSVNLVSFRFHKVSLCLFFFSVFPWMSSCFTHKGGASSSHQKGHLVKWGR